MDLYSSDLIRPLETAEHQFLEVLVSRFTLKRSGKGALLELHFDEQTPAIWTRQAKYDLQKMIPNFAEKAKRYQGKLDRFLLDGKGSELRFDDADFPFRYTSGGTLPIVRRGDEDYYCLLYREIPPIGWNIANGGSDSRSELLNPLETLERELREELIIVDPVHRRRYVFDWDAGKPVDRPEFAIARRFWEERFRRQGYPSFEELEETELPLKWLQGPDSLAVRIGKDDRNTASGFFLNINAEDSGIEVDRIARMNVDEEAVLCDGEIVRGQLVNRPVGLFETTRFHRALRTDKREFMPDLFFYDAGCHKSSELERVIRKEFIPSLADCRTDDEMKGWRSAGKKYDLCPVTRRLVRRCAAWGPAARGRRRTACDVFISFGSEDTRLARRVYDFLGRKSAQRVFFSEETIHDVNYSQVIDDALDSANALVVVATDPAHLKKEWVEFEWRSFHIDMCNGRKGGGARLVPFISGFDPNDLPRPLRVRQVVFWDPHRSARSLGKLAQLVC